MRTQVVIEQLLVEALGLLAAVEKQAMFRRPFGAEIIGGAAHRDHQRVIPQAARRDQFFAILVQRGRQMDLPTGTVQPGHAPELKLEVVPLGLRHVVQLVLIRVERTGSHFVQQRFPDVSQVGVHQRDAGRTFLAQGFTQTGRQLQTASASANDNNTMRHKDYSEGLRNSGEARSSRAQGSS
ncbi:putative proteinH dehydrogenase [Pseudomonas syringae pv. coriandricola]|uniref:Uncharacterized protein n=1 Tax=Pseudomonas syringae pv. coriandricola TaxID=264453 RepID=A0A3M3JLB9_9PSED|nr:putative proteinH dehydrogenase [Pseudomonas syringae pv. coriandricola]